MLSVESIEWIERAGHASDWRAQACWFAGIQTHRRTAGSFEQGMLAYGVAYCIDIVNGELDQDNAYAWGWAMYARKLVLSAWERA